MIPFPYTLIGGSKKPIYYGFSENSTSSEFDYNYGGVVIPTDAGILVTSPASQITLTYVTLMTYFHTEYGLDYSPATGLFPWVLLPKASPSFALYNWYRDVGAPGETRISIPTKWNVTATVTIDDTDYRGYKWIGTLNKFGQRVGLASANDMNFYINQS
jgi:hypothetical protein